MYRIAAPAAAFAASLCLVACDAGAPLGSARGFAHVEVSAQTMGDGAEDFIYVVEALETTHLLPPGEQLGFDVQPGPEFTELVVRLLAIPPHCSATQNPAVAEPIEGDTVAVQFRVWCNGPVAGRVAVVAELPLSLIAGFDSVGGGARALARGTDPRWAPDGSRLAFVEAQPSFSQLRLLNPETGTITAVHDAATWYGPADDLAWSSDGSRLAVALAESIRIFPISGGAHVVLSPGLGLVRDVAWSPAGDSLIIATDSVVALVSATEQAAEPVVLELLSPVTSASAPAWSPAGGPVSYVRISSSGFGGGGDGGGAWDGWGFSRTSLGAGRSGSGALLIRRTDGTVMADVASATDYAWSPDGSRVAIAAQGSISVISPDGTELRTHPAYGGISWTSGGDIRVVSDAIHVFPSDGGAPTSTGQGSILVLMGSRAEWR